jgi:hypothetical protein
MGVFMAGSPGLRKEGGCWSSEVILTLRHSWSTERLDFLIENCRIVAFRSAKVAQLSRSETRQ